MKAYSMLMPDTCRALAGATHTTGLPLVGQVPKRVTLPEALEVGQDRSEHSVASPAPAPLVKTKPWPALRAPWLMPMIREVP